MVDLTNRLTHLKKALDKAKTQGLNLNRKTDFSKSILDYNKRRQLYYQDVIENSIKAIKKFRFDGVKLDEISFFKTKNLIKLIEKYYEERDFVKLAEVVSECLEISEQNKLVDADDSEFKVNFFPLEIKDEVEADIAEMKRCFDNECYRSAIILCGRVLEIGLHRKYFEKTGIDSLEKSPGIGLGKLIAKLREKEINFEPGITQQIHLINQVRINSVHKKKDAYKPTKEQTQAMMLYTIDTLNRLFLK